MTNWPTLNATDVISGQAAARTVPQGLWDRLVCSLQSAGHVHVNGSTGAASWATVFTFVYSVSPAAQLSSTAELKLYLHATVSSTGDVRLADGATKGPTVAVPSTGFYEITLPILSSYYDTRITFTVEAQVVSATIILDCDDIIQNLRIID